MVDLPEALKRQRLSSQLDRQGTVFRFRCDDLDDPEVLYRHKFAVVVGHAIENDEVLYALTTSKTEPFQRSPWSGQVLRVPVGAYSFFRVETIVDLRDVKVITLETLLGLSTPSDLDIVGTLTADDVGKSIELIRKNPTVDRGLRTRCCPPP